MRRCALAFAREIERRAPELVTTAWWKEERGEGLHRLQPECARPDDRLGLLAVRAAGCEAVSAPVAWDELPDVETEDFTLVTMPGRFAELGDVQAASTTRCATCAAARVGRARRGRRGGGPVRRTSPRCRASHRAYNRRARPRVETRRPASSCRRARQQPFDRERTAWPHFGRAPRDPCRAGSAKLRAVAEAVPLHLVVPHLDHKLGTHRLLLEPAAAQRLGSRNAGPAPPRAAAAPALRSRRGGLRRRP